MGGLQFPPLTYAEWSWEGRSRFDSDGNRFFGVKWDKFRSGADYLELSGWAKEEYVRRIVASVNATAGISVEALEAGCIAELVEWAEIVLHDWHSETGFVAAVREATGHPYPWEHGEQGVANLRDALAKVKGEAA